MKNLTAVIISFLCACLSGCAPEGVPSGASIQLSIKGGFNWTWNRPLEHGCVLWMAKERWAEVLLVVDVKCDESRDELYLEGRGLTYLTFTDQLVFQGYWPWSSQDFHDVMEFDSKGMISNIRPCPHMLTFEQLQAMRVVAQEALAEATTDAERRVMARIDELLAATDGAALSSAQSGCTNLPRVRTGEQDPWAEH